jgi:hypothetical protein
MAFASILAIQLVLFKEFGFLSFDPTMAAPVR